MFHAYDRNITKINRKQERKKEENTITDDIEN
jgi:hypothetical protein